MTDRVSRTGRLATRMAAGCSVVGVPCRLQFTKRGIASLRNTWAFDPKIPGTVPTLTTWGCPCMTDWSNDGWAGSDSHRRFLGP